MLNHFVMFKLKPECRDQLDEVVSQLESLEGKVPAIRSSRVYRNDLTGPNSYDVMFHIVVDDENAFRNDYMLHPDHVPVQRFIEERVGGIADIDDLNSHVVIGNVGKRAVDCHVLSDSGGIDLP